MSQAVTIDTTTYFVTPHRAEDGGWGCEIEVYTEGSRVTLTLNFERLGDSEQEAFEYAMDHLATMMGK